MTTSLERDHGISLLLYDDTTVGINEHPIAVAVLTSREKIVLAT